MKINPNIRRVKNILDANSPVILTGIAVAGACLTTYLAARGGMNAKSALDDALLDKRTNADGSISGDAELTKVEKFTATYKFYAPAAVSLTGTCVSMVMATKIGLDRTAALAGTLIVAERANDQYKDKVKELLGENKHTKVQDAVAKDNVDKMPALPAPREGEQTFIDAWTGRHFSSTMVQVEKAVNDFNKDMLYNGYASLNEFYHRIDLEPIQEGDQIGWSIGDGRDTFLVLAYTTLLKDERAVVSFQFAKKPMPTFRDADI